MKQINKLLTLIICTYNVNCSEYMEVFKCDNDQLQHNMEIQNLDNNKQIGKHNNTIQDRNNNMKVINIKNHNSNKNIQHSNNIIINIQNDNKYNNTSDTKYNTHSKSKSLPVLHNIHSINVKQYKLSYDVTKQQKQIEYLKQALSGNYYKNDYPISSPMLCHDTITNAETEQSTIKFTANNIGDHNSLISQGEISTIKPLIKCNGKFSTMKDSTLRSSITYDKIEDYNSIESQEEILQITQLMTNKEQSNILKLSSIPHAQNDFDIFMKNNNLQCQSDAELVLAKYWFGRWHENWNNIHNNITKKIPDDMLCELVVTKILYTTVHYFYKFISDLIKCRKHFEYINKSCLFTYIQDECINNNNFLNVNCNKCNIFHDPVEMVKKYNIKYGFIKNNKVYASAVTYIMYRTTKLLQDLLWALSNKYYESTLQLKSIMNAFQPEYNSIEMMKKLGLAKEKYKEVLSALRKEYEKNTKTINENKLKSNKLKNKLYEIKHTINQYGYWIVHEQDKLQIQSYKCKLAECKGKYNNGKNNYKIINSNIVKLKSYENELIKNIKRKTGKIIKYNSICHALNYINSSESEKLISELLEQINLIQDSLKKYYDSKSKLDSLLSNITCNNNKATKQSFDATERNKKQSFDALKNDDINTSNNTQSFFKMNSNEININHKDQFFNNKNNSININNSKQLFNIPNGDKININNNNFNILGNNNTGDNDKSFIDLNNKKINTNNNINISDNKNLFNKTEVNNVINKIQKLCEELDFQKENIKYYIVFLKEIMQQIFNNNTSDKNKVNQFV